MANNYKIYLLVLALAILVFAASAQASTLVVCPDCDYRSIQPAIDAAEPGDLIEIQSGTYYEKLNITKPVRLQGVNSGNGRPVIDGQGRDTVIAIFADGTEVKGLIIKGSGPKDPGMAVFSNRNTIAGNEFSHEGKDGLLMQRASNNLIADNLLAYNGRNGIFLQESNNNILRNNTASYNSNAGILLEKSSSNTLEGNVASKNKDGIQLDQSGANSLLKNMPISNSRDGIGLQESYANNLIGNNASYDYNGMRLTRSAENRLQENFVGFCQQNGIRLVQSSGNTLWQNTLTENLLDAYDDGDSNRWYDPEGKVGNYYSGFRNCSDADNDGICDQPYAISGGQGIDRYPLTAAKPQELLFIEVWTREQGQLEEGTFARMMIDSPMYRLRDSTLRSVYELDMPVGTMAVAGSGLSLAGDLGGGATSSLYPVTELPYQMGNVTLFSLDGDSVTVGFRGQQKILTPGESWQEEWEETRTVGDARMLVKATTTISNHGRVALVKASPV